jgi:hypothetical protein
VVQTAPASTDVLAAPVRPASAPVRLTSMASRKVVSIGWWLIAVQGGLLAWVSSQGFPYWDDYLLQGRAAQFPLLSRGLLLYAHDGHLMPAGMAIAWVTVRLAPLSPLGVTVGVVAMQLVASTAVFVMLRTLLGTRPAVLAPLGIYLFSPLILPSSLWWSAALNLLPMQAALAAAITCHIRYLRSGHQVWVGGTLISIASALAFFEKSVIIPAALIGVTAALAAAEGRHPVAAVVHRWRLWLVLALPVAGYLAVYLTTVPRPTTQIEVSGQLGSLVANGIGRAFVPAAFGGPLAWQPTGFASAIVAPDAWFVAVVWALLLLVALLTIWARPSIGWAYGALAGYLMIDLAALVFGRGGSGLAAQIVLSLRYTAEAAVVLAVVVGLALAAPLGASEPPHVRDLRLRLQRSSTASRLSAFVVADLFIALCLVSSLGLERIWAANPARIWIGNARASLAVADPSVPLLSDPVPEYVLYGLSYPGNLSSNVLAPLPHRPQFAQSTTGLLAFDAFGHLSPASVVGPTAVLPGTADCLRLPEGGGELTLDAPVINWEHTAFMKYDSTGGPVAVSLGTGQPVTVDTVAGEGQLAFRLTGGGSSLSISPIQPGAQLCISVLKVGQLVPGGSGS